MKKVLACVLAAALLSGCTVLPAEERAFAVCLGLGKNGDTWEACARLPTYTAPGEYVTVSAKGQSLAEAMTLLDAAAPIRVHYGQVRMVILTRELASGAAFRQVMDALSRLNEFRGEARLCVTEEPLTSMMDALTPQSGTRLSKYLEVMTASRIGLGVAPDTRVSDVWRMGQRQSPLLADIALASQQQTTLGMDASAGALSADGLDIQLAGAWMLSLDGRVTGRLTAEENQLVQLLRGTLHKGALMLPSGSLTIIDGSSRIYAYQNTVRCHVRLRYRDAQGYTPDGIRDAIVQVGQAVLGKLAAASCDALGIGRRMIRWCPDEQAWQALSWPERYPQLQWEIIVSLQGEA